MFLKEKQRVKTPFGPGVIQQIDFEYAHVLLDSSNKLMPVLHKYVTPLEEIQPIAQTPVTPTPPPENPFRSIPSPVKPQTSMSISSPRQPSRIGTAGARRAIEALRFGLVPESHLGSLTIGYDKLSGWTQNHLNPCTENPINPTISMVIGDFGTGKSHAMAVVRRIARENGFLTASVEIDGNKVALSRPDELLHSLWTNLELEENTTTTPLLSLYCKAITRNSLPAPDFVIGDHIIDRLHENYEVVKVVAGIPDLMDEMADKLDAVLSGSNVFPTADVIKELQRHVSCWDFNNHVLRPAIGRDLVNRPLDFVQNLAGHAQLAKLAGFKGLAITIDELEIEDLQTPQYRERAINNLSMILKYLVGNEPGLINAPMALFLAGIEGQRFVGQFLEGWISEHIKNGIWRNPAWNSKDRLELAGRIHSLYLEAYGISGALPNEKINVLEGRQKQSIGADGCWIRGWIRAVTSICDQTYGPPQ